MSQSSFMSLIESVSNLIVGYVLAVAMQIVALPWFGLHPSVGQNLAIGALFSAMSLLRSYALRRLFENWRRS